MSWYKFVSTLVSIFYKLAFRVEVSGMENVPRQGGFLLCCNHKSNNDPPFLASFMPVQLAFLAKSELFKPPVFGSLLRSLGAIPLHRNAHDSHAIKTSMSIMRQGRGLLVFPQGGRRKVLEQKDFRPGSLTMAYRVQVPVIPVLIEGNYRIGSKMYLHVGKPIQHEELGLIIASAPDAERNNVLSHLIYERISGLSKQ